MSLWDVALAAVLSLGQQAPFSEVSKSFRDIGELLFPPAAAVDPPGLAARALDSMPLPDENGRYPGHVHPLQGVQEGPPMLAWGRDRMLAWTDGRLCVFDVASLAAVWSHESEKPHALLMDELDRPFWLSSHGLRNFGDEGGVTLWSLASATNTPVKVVRLGMYRENVGLFGAAAAADRWTTDLWFFTQEFHPWRIRVHATAVPVVGPIEAFGWDVRQGIAARGHRVTLGGGKTGEIQSHALHRFSTARDFNDWIASLSPGAEDDEVWALFSSRVLRLDVGRRGIPITGGFRITPIGFPIRVVASGNSVAVVTTNGVTVYDQRGRVRLPLVEFDRERKDMDVALSPEGDRLAVWTDLSLRMWDVKKRTSTPMRCR